MRDSTRSIASLPPFLHNLWLDPLDLTPCPPLSTTRSS